jgi:hypothetical protein
LLFPLEPLFERLSLSGVLDRPRAAFFLCLRERRLLSGEVMEDMDSVDSLEEELDPEESLRLFR